MPRPGGGSKKNGFKAPLSITPELSAFLGRDKVSRPQLTKLMWAYFKSQKLMDPTDKRFVLCDDKLKALTGEDRFQAFSFMKLLNKHIIKNGDGAAAKDEPEAEEEAAEEEAGGAADEDMGNGAEAAADAPAPASPAAEPPAAPTEAPKEGEEEAAPAAEPPAAAAAAEEAAPKPEEPAAAPAAEVAAAP